MQKSPQEEKKEREEMGDEAWYNHQSKRQEFDPRVVPADAVTLCTVRFAEQSMNDHYLGSYRCGLGMPVRMNMGTEHCPDEEEQQEEAQGGGKDSKQKKDA
jgi:hypothetical protein